MRKTLVLAAALLVASMVATAQAPEPPLADTRLTVHTLLREDIFAGFLQNDLVRLARAEKNLDQLLESRPKDRPSLLAWQGAIALTRAVLASEAKSPDFQRHYRRATDLWAEAMREGATDGAVWAIVGGTNATLGPRLPATEQKAAWEQGYGAYATLMRLQAPVVPKLPLHMKGELLTGLAQTAQRSGRVVEAEGYLDQIVTTLADTPYAKLAQEWKSNPKARASGNLTCKTCHAPGTLAARLAEVSKAGAAN